MIGYLESCRDKVLKECTPAKFQELTESQRTAMLIQAYRSGENPDAKNQLPAFVFMGYDPAMLEGKTGKRQKDCLKPTGLVMFDFDHLKENYNLTPHETYERFLNVMPKIGLTPDDNLALAHTTCSNNGLRTVICPHNAGSVAQIQEQVSQLLGIECDKAVKDLSRLSFVPIAKDILYLNQQLLFAPVDNNNDGNDDPHPAPPEPRPAPPHSQPAPPHLRFPQEYHGVSYRAIVDKWIELRGGTPEPGDRHATLVELAMDLRKICDNNKEWIASLMPDFDKGEQEKMYCIDWAVGRQHSRISGTLYEALAALGIARNTETQPKSTTTPEGTEESLPPDLPHELPSLVALLTSKVLDHQKAAVACMMFPALATHVNNCLFRLRDNTATELSLMCCLLATQSAGKGCVKPPLQLIMKDIKSEDTINRKRERDWQESQKNKKANEKGASRPDDIIVRILSADTTPAAFLGRLFAAENGDAVNPNLCTYSQVDEIEDLYSFCATSGRNKVQQMIKRTWDRDDIGAERWGPNSANLNTVLRWNWAASSTIEGGKKFFRNCLTDGTTSRVDFCTIIPPAKVIDFRYGDYDLEFEEQLKPYIDHLKAFSCPKDENGAVIPAQFPQVLALENSMNQYINDTASTMPDDTWVNYAWRAKVMAVKKLIVLYIASGCQWEDSFENFAWWTFHYTMWCKMNLFYDAASDAFRDECIRSNKGHRSPLRYLKREFTFADLVLVCRQHGFKSPDTTLRKWKQRDIITVGDNNTFIVAPYYARKFGIE